MLDVLCLGNALIDCFLKLSHPEHDEYIDQENMRVAFPLGAKIPIENVTFLPGGNASNVSVGLSRLSKKTGIMSEIGNDIFAKQITDEFSKEGVITDSVVETSGSSSFAISIMAGEDRTLFVEHIFRKHEFVFSDLTPGWLYITSLGKEWRKAYRDAVEFAKNNNVKIAFNPGTPQLEDGVETFDFVLKETEILFVNLEEARQILGKKEDVAVCLKSLQSLGPRIVVITSGKEGSDVVDKNGEVLHQEINDSPVVERTGAGDAYISGFLASYMEDHNIKKAMSWGTMNAASVVGKVGAQAGLLKKHEIEGKVR